MVLRSSLTSVLVVASILGSSPAFSTAKSGRWQYSGHQPVVTEKPTGPLTEVETNTEKSWREWAQENAYAIGGVGVTLVIGAITYALVNKKSSLPPTQQVLLTPTQPNPVTPTGPNLRELAKQNVRHLLPKECRDLARDTNRFTDIRNWATTGAEKSNIYIAGLIKKAGGALTSCFAPGETYSPEEFAEEWEVAQDEIYQNYQDLQQQDLLLGEDADPFPPIRFATEEF